MENLHPGTVGEEFPGTNIQLVDNLIVTREYFAMNFLKNEVKRMTIIRGGKEINPF